MWKSPNGTIRAIAGRHRVPYPYSGARALPPLSPAGEKPITIARHAYGDVYKNVEATVPAGAKAELVGDKGGRHRGRRQLIHNFETPGIIQGLHNIDKSIESFARACFNFALDMKQDLWFATKDTISKKYDHRFKDIFQEIYDKEYAEKFEKAGI